MTLNEFFDSQHIKPSRDFLKWFLELLRNLLVVAVLQALATKTESKAVWTLAKMAPFALTLYVSTFPLAWMADKIGARDPSKSKARFIWYALGIVAVTLVVGQVLTIGLNLAIKDLALLQK